MVTAIELPVVIYHYSLPDWSYVHRRFLPVNFQHASTPDMRMPIRCIAVGVFQFTVLKTWNKELPEVFDIIFILIYLFSWDQIEI